MRMQLNTILMLSCLQGKLGFILSVFIPLDSPITLPTTHLLQVDESRRRGFYWAFCCSEGQRCLLWRWDR
ncbi:hypothetical protein BDA96_01G300300 [Sorghum bicolor]|uniref:Uncharacterized protein n=1 Tax=Sorghum bicolor TaxID=4558 RepID=A0A921S257_SORBI|nr:hypothetical protein BDA96_01G300300 [Sorghum bicolor]